MLKIAEYNTITGEKIDLKELEKYGFKEWSFLYEFTLDGEYGESIVINKTDRIIEITSGMSGTILELNILYDLIKDGIVEKVGDE